VSKAKGRKYEREIIGLLRDRGLTVLDVAANCGVYEEHQCDLLIDVDGDLARGEVKFRHGGDGFRRVYARHEAECPRGIIMWTVGEDLEPYYSALLPTYIEHLADDWGYMDRHEVQHKLPDAVRGWLSGRDVLFCRMSRREWLVVWRMNE
jgi:hypothetical protein